MIYYKKYPRQAFKRPKHGYRRSAEAMVAEIQEDYQPGYTSEPYVQLVELDDEGNHTVLAEWMPGDGWTDPLVAAGFKPRSIHGLSGVVFKKRSSRKRK